ncbi:mannosyltransferase putative-domain-containing protein [Scheffersomyces coipomensis]|uniref:mannosyltransferase putative-domain-containing protein n=1 Tax=Scheffersomyces coipomensis TaxID=1788519 RepID=UPI00315D7271
MSLPRRTYRITAIVSSALFVIFILPYILTHNEADFVEDFAKYTLSNHQSYQNKPKLVNTPSAPDISALNPTKPSINSKSSSSSLNGLPVQSQKQQSQTNQEPEFTDPTKSILSRIPMIGKHYITYVYSKQQQVLNDRLLKDSITTNHKSILNEPNIGFVKSNEVHDFWNHVFTIFTDNKFNITEGEELIVYTKREESEDDDKKDDESSYEPEGDHSPSSKSNNVKKNNPYSKKSLLGKANITDYNIQQIKVNHANVLRQLPTNLDPVTFKKDSKGIVLIGGGFFSWLSYLSILHLRDNGSKLPIELILPQWQDYNNEYKMCNEILPKLNARCVVIPDVLGHHVVSRISIGSYQLKSIAIAISTFEHVLFLDSDNIAVTNPDSVFDSKVYKKNGLILWPDYWQRSLSPIYYEIAQKPVNEDVRVRWNRYPLINAEFKTETNIEQFENYNYHEYLGTIPDLSTESGQIVYNKGTHGKSLLMTLYYNLYGPQIYYRLFSLGELGEGDKDTFITGAFVTNTKYYQVHSYIQTLGYFDENGYHGMAMGQKDPIIDYELLNENYAKFSKLISARKPKSKNKKKKKIAGTHNEFIDNFDDEIDDRYDQVELIDEMQTHYFGGSSEIPLFALHCNIKKVNPKDYTNDESISNFDENRMKQRMYSQYRFKIDNEDVDFELKRWELIQKALCIDKISFKALNDNDDASTVNKTCNYINNTVNWLFSNSEVELAKQPAKTTPLPTKGKS